MWVGTTVHLTNREQVRQEGLRPQWGEMGEGLWGNVLLLLTSIHLYFAVYNVHPCF